MRVVIIDDSAVVRGFIARWVTDSGDLQIAGTANDGLDGIALVKEKRPDIVVLDIEMPRLDGLQALPRILAAAPGCKVLMASRLTIPGARACLQCLEQGAADVIAKPAFQKDLAALNEFRADLLAKIRGLGQATVANAALSSAGRTPPAGGASSTCVAMHHDMPSPDILMIGASTGGPQAINEFLTEARPFLQHLPLVIAQHMPGLFTSVFADHLVRTTGREAREAAHGEAVRPGVIYVAPGGRHTSFVNREGRVRFVVSDEPPIRFSRPSIDRLLESGADAYGAHAWCLLLTGMGQDGLIGAQAIASAGGQIFAQDEQSSVVWGIPGAIVRAGLAHCVASPKGTAQAMTGMIAELRR